MTPRNTDNVTPFGAQRLPSTSEELRASAKESAYLNDRFDSSSIARDKGFDSIYTPFYDKIEAADPKFARDVTYSDYAKYFNEPSPTLGNRLAYSNEEAKHAYLADRAGSLDIEFPDFKTAYDDAHLKGLDLARDSYEQYMSDMAYTQAKSPRLQAALGAIGPTMTDPMVVGSIVATLPFGVTALALRAAAFEAGVATMAEIPIQIQRQRWYAEQGRELTTDEVMTNILLAAGTAGVIGGGVSKIYKMAGGTSTRIMPTLDSTPKANIQAVADAHSTSGGALFDTGEDIFWLTPNRIKPTPEDAPFNIVAFGVDDMVDEAAQPLSIDAAPAGRRVTTVGGKEVPTGGLEAAKASYPDNSLALAYDIALDEAYPLASPHRNYATGFVQEERMREMNPAFGGGLKYPAQQLDRYSYAIDTARLSKMHDEALQEAVTALAEGRIPSPEGTKQLSLHLNVSDPAQRQIDVRKILAEGSKINTQSPRYRQVRLNILEAAFREKWQKLIDDVREVYPKGSALPTPKLPKPKQTLKQAELTVKRAEDKLAKATAEVKETRKALYKEQNAWTKQYNILRKAEDEEGVMRHLAKGEKLKARQAALKEKLDTAQKGVEDAQGRLNKFDPYIAERLEIERVRAAIAAEDVLDKLVKGKLPRSFMTKPLIKQIDKAMEAAHKAIKKQELITDDIAAEVLPRFERSGSAKDIAHDFNSRLDTGETAKAINKAMDEANEAAFSRLVDEDIVDVKFNPDGSVSQITKAQLDKDLADSDAILEALSTCGLGA